MNIPAFQRSHLIRNFIFKQRVVQLVDSIIILCIIRWRRSLLDRQTCQSEFYISLFISQAPTRKTVNIGFNFIPQPLNSNPSIHHFSLEGYRACCFVLAWLPPQTECFGKSGGDFLFLFVLFRTRIESNYTFIRTVNCFRLIYLKLTQIN
jgi:hypothetical protein